MKAKRTPKQERIRFIMRMITLVIKEYHQNGTLLNDGKRLTFTKAILQYGARVSPRLTRQEVIKVLTSMDLTKA